LLIKAIICPDRCPRLRPPLLSAFLLLHRFLTSLARKQVPRPFCLNLVAHLFPPLSFVFDPGKKPRVRFFYVTCYVPLFARCPPLFSIPSFFPLFPCLFPLLVRGLTCFLPIRPVPNTPHCALPQNCPSVGLFLTIVEIGFFFSSWFLSAEVSWSFPPLPQA